METSSASDWRPLNQDFALYMTLHHGTVVIELAPEFAGDFDRASPQLAAEFYRDRIRLCNVPLPVRMSH